LGLRARAERVKMLFRGQWEYWNSLNLNVNALECLGAYITDQNGKSIDNFTKMRCAAWLPQRLWYFLRSGVYR
jgi:hypothetical protein